MSRDITDWIKHELYPALFENIDRALPEHDFNRYSGGWRSKTYLDGSPHKDRTDKTIVSKRALGVILEQGGEVLSLVSYVMRRDGVEFIQAVKTLATVAGLQIPKGDFNQESYQSYKDRATLLEACNGYFIYCLENSSTAEEVRSYLSSRGYSQEDVKAMELGYIPGQDKLYKYLLSKGYKQELIDEVIKLNTGIGSTHRLTIPYRSGGSIRGFKFRTIGDAKPKYLNSTGLDRIGGFFNISGLKGDKDVVIVEGELDSLHATAKGLDNVVATGGSSVSPEQVKDAIRRGAKSFTLCLDTEPDKLDETSKRIASATEVILMEGVNNVYTVTLPDLGGGKTDPDRLIKESGVEALKKAIAGAIPYYEYKLQETLNRYAKIEDESGELQPKDVHRLLDEVEETAANISDPTHRDLYKKLFISLEAIQSLGITEESLSETVDRLTTTRAKEAQSRALREALVNANQLQATGRSDEAIKALETQLTDLKVTGARDLLPPPMSFNSLLAEIADTPPAYKTGYVTLDRFIGFTPGAVNLVAGRPSHGKTTFMFNLLLEMSKLYPDEKFYFFTYEEPVKNISVKLLNRLIASDLRGHFKEVKDLSRPTNYDFIKHYIKAGRTDLREIEEGKRLLRELIDSRRVTVIERDYSVEELDSLLLYLSKKERIGSVIIDYIQRMRTERKTQDKKTEVSIISNQLRKTAVKTGLPIILGAQLNRATDIKVGKPKLENLKESGSLEEDANTVISVFCRAREEEELDNGATSSKERIVDLEIRALKNRDGEVNTVETLDWDRWTGVMRDRASSKSRLL